MAQYRNDPLTARSVLASALLGSEPPELRVAHLLHLVGLFGINENRARVALSRMVASGEATTAGPGRYRLAGHLLDRQSRQIASRAGHTRPWTGDWSLVVVTTSGSSAEVRARRRQAFAFARLGELRDGTWLRPDNVDVALPDDVVGDVLRMTGRLPDGRSPDGRSPDGRLLDGRPPDDRELAHRLWDLDGWARRADELAAGLAERPPSGRDDLAPGFELSAAVLRHFQADPLLPADLLPPGWPGDRLRRTYDDWDRRYREVLAAWSRRR
jgi:phenylacetic acid degradation operon negative regulatory protein